MDMAIGVRVPCPNTLSFSFRRRSPEVRALPRKWKTYRLLNSSARHLRSPSAVLASMNPPLVTNPITPRSLMRSDDHRIALMYESYSEFLFVADDLAA